MKVFLWKQHRDSSLNKDCSFQSYRGIASLLKRPNRHSVITLLDEPAVAPVPKTPSLRLIIGIFFDTQNGFIANQSFDLAHVIA